MNAQVKPKQWTEMKTIIALLLTMVALLMGNTIIGVTNTINGSNRETRLTKVEENYVRTSDLVWISNTWAAEAESMMLYARKDSASAVKAHKLYNDLRKEMFQIMLGNRGSDGTSTNATGQ